MEEVTDTGRSSLLLRITNFPNYIEENARQKAYENIFFSCFRIMFLPRYRSMPLKEQKCRYPIKLKCSKVLIIRNPIVRNSIARGGFCIIQTKDNHCFFEVKELSYLFILVKYIFRSNNLKCISHEYNITF